MIALMVKKAFLLIAPVSLSVSAVAQTTGRQPDIILIMTDQHRADAMGCTSDGIVITPNLDSLAKDGYLFSNAYSSTPSSTPARAGLLTGCMSISSSAHNMRGWRFVVICSKISQIPPN